MSRSPSPAPPQGSPSTSGKYRKATAPLPDTLSFLTQDKALAHALSSGETAEKRVGKIMFKSISPKG